MLQGLGVGGMGLRRFRGRQRFEPGLGSASDLRRRWALEFGIPRLL